MANLEVIRRFSEEFFGYSPTVFVVPQETDSLAVSLEVALDIPDFMRYVVEFTDEVCEHPFVDGFALVIDAWQGEEDGKVGGAHIFIHYFVSEQLSLENRSTWQLVRLPHELDVPLGRKLYEEFERTNRPLTTSSSTWDVSDRGLEEGLKLLIQHVFHSDPGMFGVDRVDSKPPSGFVIAVVERES